jgi:DNA modification methylase
MGVWKVTMAAESKKSAADEQPDGPRPQAIHEQLSLFPSGAPTECGSHLAQGIRQDPPRLRLARLLQGDLDFHGEDSSYGSHSLHAFAAKFPPQIPSAFIRALTQPGDVVLDPMMGSGTTVVEAMLQGRRGIGLDIDPLALRLTSAKTQPLDLDQTRQLASRVLRRSSGLLADAQALERILASAFDDETRKFIDYWFLEHTQRELMALSLAIREVDEPSQRRFLELIFSSTIVTKSGGVSMARDLAHTRPHLDPTKMPRSALDEFSQRLAKGMRGMASLVGNGTHAMVAAADARAMPLHAESVDLVVTSPPYANAIDYMRAHKFSLVWLGSAVGQLSGLRARYIGSERLGHTIDAPLPGFTEAIIAEVEACDRRKAHVLRKYYCDMRLVASEMYRVLRHGSAAVIVVGTSTMRNVSVETHRCLAELGTWAGFNLVGTAERRIDRDRRMMPARTRRTDSGIEKRMHEEYVIGLHKE